MRYLPLIVLSLAATFFAQVASADEMYTYVGHPYAFCDGTYASGPPFIPPCRLPYKVEGSFTTSLTLPQLENLSNFSLPDADITSFSFTDGSGTFITSQDGRVARLIISTNALGAIGGDWQYFMVGPTLEVMGADCAGDCSGGEDGSQTLGDAPEGDGGTAFENAGGWSGPVDSETSSLPVPTPEPGTLFLLCNGLIGICASIYRRRL